MTENRNIISIYKKRFLHLGYCILIYCILSYLLMVHLSPDVFDYPELLSSREWNWHRKISKDTIIDNINTSCESVFAGNSASVDLDVPYLEELISKSSDRCTLYRKSFGFDKSDPSEEEKDFPLAYAVLAHNRLIQFLLMLSSFYEKHNVFCISLPSNTDYEFSRGVYSLSECFENIHVIHVGKVIWGSYEILNSTYNCMKYLYDEQPVQWRYLQYLSGVDVPLRTNLEMVQVLKQWNGISHTLIHRYAYRLESSKKIPVPLFKSSLSAIIARKAANIMIEHPKAKELLYCLRGTIVADESFWSSVLGNPDVFDIPGGFKANDFLKLVDKFSSLKPSTNCSHFPCHTKGFVARHQIWERRNCRGLFVNSSCVFGIYDLAHLIASPAFVAHKFYIEHDPAALICMLKEVNGRRAYPDKKFDATQYNHLPQIEFSRSGSLTNLTRLDLLYSSTI